MIKAVVFDLDNTLCSEITESGTGKDFFCSNVPDGRMGTKTV